MLKRNLSLTSYQAKTDWILNYLVHTGLFSVVPSRFPTSARTFQCSSSRRPLGSSQRGLGCQPDLGGVGLALAAGHRSPRRPVLQRPMPAVPQQRAACLPAVWRRRAVRPGEAGLKRNQSGHQQAARPHIIHLWDPGWCSECSPSDLKRDFAYLLLEPTVHGGFGDILPFKIKPKHHSSASWREQALHTPHVAQGCGRWGSHQQQNAKYISNISKISTKCNCDLQVFPSSIVKHISCISWILSIEVLQQLINCCLLLFAAVNCCYIFLFIVSTSREYSKLSVSDSFAISLHRCVFFQV